MTLSAVSTLVDKNLGKICFKAAATLDALADGVQGLTVQTDGLTEFDAAVGDTHPLAYLAVSGFTALGLGTTDLNGQRVTTTEPAPATVPNGQTYYNPVTLSVGATLVDKNLGKICFKAAATLDALADGVQGLTVQTDGLTEFDAAVGDTHPLAYLAVSGFTALGLGTTDLNGQRVTTTEPAPATVPNGRTVLQPRDAERGQHAGG